MALYMRFEAGFLKIKKVNPENKADGLKIIFMTDLHIERLFIKSTRIFSIIKKERPDYIILGGDYLDYPQNASRVIELFKGLAILAPTIAIAGNHDYTSFKKHPDERTQFFNNIKKSGVQLLINESIYTTKHNKKYKITGIDDLHSGSPDISCIKKEPGTDQVILVSHNPDIIYKIPENSVDYILAGHIHAGQIRTPLGIEFSILRNDRIYKDGIISGLHKFRGISLYLSNGIGNTFLPFRFLARPDITILTL
jgi:predicted MPP superfamily phosphohydrolase